MTTFKCRACDFKTTNQDEIVAHANATAHNFTGYLNDNMTKVKDVPPGNIFQIEGSMINGI